MVNSLRLRTTSICEKSEQKNRISDHTCGHPCEEEGALSAFGAACFNLDRDRDHKKTRGKMLSTPVTRDPSSPLPPSPCLANNTGILHYHLPLLLLSGNTQAK